MAVDPPDRLSCLFWTLYGERIRKRLCGGRMNYKSINFYKFSGKDKQEEKCVGTIPGSFEQARGVAVA